MTNFIHSQPLQTVSPLPKNGATGCLMRNHELIQIPVTKGNKYATDVARYNSNRTSRRKQDFCPPYVEFLCIPKGDILCTTPSKSTEGNVQILIFSFPTFPKYGWFLQTVQNLCLKPRYLKWDLNSNAWQWIY